MAIRMTSHGFMRSPEDDFTDDGNRFTCYRLPDVPNVRVSVCVDRGEYYISARDESCELTYEEYSKLPCYHEMDMLNGCSESYVKENMQKFIECIHTYENAYREAVNNLQQVSDDEIKEIYKNKYRDLLMKMINDIRSRINFNIFNIKSEWDFKRLKEYYDNLIRDFNCYSDERACGLAQISRRREVINKDKQYSNWYYQEMNNILSRVGL